MKLHWRKLLSDPPSAWVRLPMLTRGVGDEVLRAVDANGEIDLGDEPTAVVVCRLAAAHPRERRRVAEAIEELIAAGFLRLDSRPTGRALCVQLPDLSLARSGREADVKRTRSQPEADVKLTRTGREVEGNSTEPLKSPPVEEKRVEEKRRDIEPPNPLAPSALPASRADVGLVFEFWKAQLGHPKAKLDRKREQVIKRAIASHGVESCKLAITGYAGDPFTLGQNDRHKRFDDIELLLRDAQHIERGAEMAARKPSPDVERLHTAWSDELVRLQKKSLDLRSRRMTKEADRVDEQRAVIESDGPERWAESKRTANAGRDAQVLGLPNSVFRGAFSLPGGKDAAG